MLFIKNKKNHLLNPIHSCKKCNTKKNVDFLPFYTIINRVIHNFDKNKFNIVFYGMFHNLSTELSTELSTILDRYKISVTLILYILIHRKEKFL